MFSPRQGSRYSICKVASFPLQPCTNYTRVPFDLTPYNRVEVDDAGQIPQQFDPVIKGILDKAARREI